MTQRVLAAEVGVSQSWLSEAERGLGAMGSLETWGALAAGIGQQLAAFFEGMPGSAAPRDTAHLQREQALISFATPGGWSGRPEVLIVASDGVQRFIDVVLNRERTSEVVVAEIVDWFADVGDDLRGLERKVEAMRALRPGCRVVGLLVVRGTNRNRSLVRELGDLFRSRFRSGADWIRALCADAPLPDGDGFLWTGATKPTMTAAHFGARPRQKVGRDHKDRSTRGLEPSEAGAPRLGVTFSGR